jgi:hypothetical protein
MTVRRYVTSVMRTSAPLLQPIEPGRALNQARCQLVSVVFG